MQPLIKDTLGHAMGQEIQAEEAMCFNLPGSEGDPCEGRQHPDRTASGKQGSLTRAEPLGRGTRHMHLLVSAMFKWACGFLQKWFLLL